MCNQHYKTDRGGSYDECASRPAKHIGNALLVNGFGSALKSRIVIFFIVPSKISGNDHRYSHNVCKAMHCILTVLILNCR